jgi:hypothetical protein
MQHILAVLRGAEFRDALVKLPGYAASDTGAIKTVNEVFHGKKS